MPGPICCLLGVCCPPGDRAQRAQALFDAYANSASRAGLHVSANWLFEHFDVVPRGVGDAVVEGYRKIFEES